MAGRGGAAAAAGRWTVPLGCQGHRSSAKWWLRGGRGFEGDREGDTEALPVMGAGLTLAKKGAMVEGDGGGARLGGRREEEGQSVCDRGERETEREKRESEPPDGYKVDCGSE